MTPIVVNTGRKANLANTSVTSQAVRFTPPFSHFAPEIDEAAIAGLAAMEGKYMLGPQQPNQPGGSIYVVVRSSKRIDALNDYVSERN